MMPVTTPAPSGQTGALHFTPDRTPAVLPHLDELARRPLTSHDVIVESIAATTTRTGLTVHAELDTDTYPVGVKIPDAQMKTLHDTGALHRHDWHPDWNYSLNPPRN